MYHYVVRGKVRDSFEQVNKGNLAAIVRQFVPGSEHWFSGSHAMAGRGTTWSRSRSGTTGSPS
jgi:hypothetical protein